MSETYYFLQPQDPLVLGTGKPLDFGLGGDTLSFPYPSTVAGALRAAHAVASGGLPNAYGRNVHVGAPLLVQAGDGASSRTWLPRPADTAYVDGEVVPLLPHDVDADAWTDGPAGLLLLGLQKPSKSKPDRAPAWWDAQLYSKWLEAPSISGQSAQANSTLGNLATDPRTHVVVDDVGKGAIMGGLFRTKGVSFTADLNMGSLHRLGLAVRVTTTEANLAENTHRRLGGEGRFARIRSISPDKLLPHQPADLDYAKHIRLVLLSPAIFPVGGWRPCWLHEDANGKFCGERHGVKLELVAAAIERHGNYSGWRMNENRAGPGRAWRVVPAGSVYWFKVVSGNPSTLWNQSLCDGEWADEGWGYALVGLTKHANPST